MSELTVRVQVALSVEELELVLNSLHQKSNTIAFSAHESDEEAWATYREITALQTRLNRNRKTALSLSE